MKANDMTDEDRVYYIVCVKIDNWKNAGIRSEFIK